MRFALRAASVADTEGLIALWQEAAENDGRPPDTAQAVTALLGRDPDAVIVADQMVLDRNDLGQNLGRVGGYRRQDDWRRWVKAL